jgi:predicted nucleic acid-binding protein
MTLMPSRLAKQDRRLVLDASVALNLLGSGRPSRILELLQREVVIEETVLDEVRVDPSDGQSGRLKLDALKAAGLLDYVRLSNAAYLIMLEITGAVPPNDLDDGEAATIAYAEEMRACVVLDDKKAIRIARMRGLTEATLNTLDLLFSSEVESAMSKDELSDLVFAALQNARMRVPNEYRKWVVALIGEARAALCPSLGKRLLRGRE